MCDIIQGIFSSVTAIICTCLVGGIGLWVWKKQRISQLAEEILIATYEIIRIINFARFPFSHDDEGTTRKKGNLESKIETSRKNAYFVPIERINQASDSLSKCESIRTKCRIYFKEASKELDALFKTIMSIQNASLLLIEYFEARELNKEPIKQAEKTIWYQGENDSINKLIDENLQNIETQLKKFL